jgi:hypothetical protein
MDEQTGKNQIQQMKKKFIVNSVITIALVIVIFTFATLLAYKIPWSFDMTAGKIFSLSNQTKQLVSSLDMPVEIIAIYPQTWKNPVISSLLDEYLKLSPRISITYIDAEREPGRLSEYELGSSAVQNGTFVVKSGSKSKTITEFDFFQETGEGRVFWGERLVTGAIRYVTKDVMPRIYFLEGHNEALITNELSKLSNFLEIDGFYVETFSLIRSNGVPEDADLIVIPSPSRDLSDEELQMLVKYLSAGGNAMVLVNPLNTNTIILNNFNLLTRAYGIDITNNIVFEEDPSSYAGNNNLFLIPGYAFHSITEKLAESKRYVVLPIAMGLHLLEGNQDLFHQDILLASSPNSWMRTDISISSGVKTDVDKSGPIPLAYAANRTALESDKGESKIVVIGNSSFIYNENIESNANRDFISSCVNWLTGSQEVDPISPRVIGADRFIVRGNEFIRLILICLVLMPFIPFSGAVLMWYLKRNQ